MKLYIKYMVSLRCKMLVKEELKKLHVTSAQIDLGFVETDEELTTEQLEKFRARLAQSGLELLDDKKAILIEKIKNVIIEMIHYTDEVPQVNYSDYISEN